MSNNRARPEPETPNPRHSEELADEALVPMMRALQLLGQSDGRDDGGRPSRSRGSSRARMARGADPRRWKLSASFK